MGSFPTGFVCINHDQISDNVYQGDYALKLETKESDYKNLYPGMAAIGILTPGYNFVPGEPYDQCPEKLTGYVKYHVENDDMLGITCELWTWNEGDKIVIATADTTFTGTEDEWSCRMTHILAFWE